MRASPLLANALISAVAALAGCGQVDDPAAAHDAPAEPGGDAGAPDAGALAPVYVVLFTHIEDSTPAGPLGTEPNRAGYLAMRRTLLDMAARAQAHDLTWVLQPDWKLLEAALLYEDAATTASTGGKNVLRYLREDLGVVIDPHSHENGGYNYTDVAHLLEQLGVGGSTVIGGHIWDPALPEFQGWDRFRAPVTGQRYPEASWRGDILIGAGTPNHVNDPLVSGVWRPQDRDHYFVDDPAGNIVALGAWHDQVAGVDELVALRAAGDVPPDAMLTASWNLQPATLTAPGGLDDVEATVLAPIAAMRDAGTVVATDFTSLVATWRSAHGATAYVHQP